MGMLIDGKWSEEDRIWSEGGYKRATSPFQGANDEPVVDRLRRTPERFLLIASDSCPWSHRARLVLAVKRMDALPVHLAHGARVEGYALAGGDHWKIPGTEREIRHLHELYAHGHPRHTGRSTVPVLWDVEAGMIVSNESADILLAFDRAFGDTTLAPPGLEAAMAETDAHIYDTLNNGVYKAGFARSQANFDAAAEGVFETLLWLERRLARTRFLHGDLLTLSDLRLFPTLVRFDPVYHFLFGCSRLRVRDLPHVWGYVRDLISDPGIRSTVDFPRMVEPAYLNDGRSASPILPSLPEIDWDAPHDRDAYGPARMAARDGGSAVFGS
ncbi:glutathione S-transferase C-terminal domain-containing protein [Jannaschia formosa]|uniref:glutathione S-transferase C-terminal domain-containing protein n=1 Tax=Jannaschia formosa TaxID=2259592 RepID=UPI000E1B5D0C|nr:glutathione S-transferase C-terminal domain-containing protein [Jannaschia formosa]TFL16626.1 glutathione-dependent reductase [Jannaschia formosa]